MDSPKMHQNIDALNKENFKALLDSTKDGYWLASAKGVILDVNNSYCAMSGYTTNEILGSNIWDFDIVQDEEGVKASIERLRQIGSATFETQHRCKNGTIIDVEISVSYSDIQGGVFFSLLRDVSEKKKLHAKTLQDRLLFETVINNIPASIFWKNNEGVYEGVNQHFLQAIGLQKSEQLLGKTDYDMHWSVLADDYRHDDIKIMHSGIPQFHYVETVSDTEGNHKIIETSKVPLKNNDGNITGILGIFTDITEKYEADRKLKESKEQFETIFRYAQDGIAIMDLESNFLEFNDAYVKLTGYTREELLTKSCIEMTTDEDKERTREAIRQAREEGVLKNFEKSCYHKDGSIITINLSVAMLPDKIRFIMSVKDVTESMNYKQRLEHDVRERTRELEIQKEAFETLFEKSSQGMLIIKEGHFIDCNAKSLEILQMKDKNELLNKHPSEISPKFQPDGVLSAEKEQKMNRKASDEGFALFEWQHLRATGESFPCEVTLVPIVLPEGGEILHVVWRDLSEEKLRKQALLKSETFLRNIMDSAIDGIVAIDDKGIITSFNRAAETLFGYDKEEVIGKNVKILVPEPHRTNHDNYIANYLKSGIKKAIGRTAELNAVRKDGTEFPSSLRIGEVTVGNQTIFTALIQNISEEKEVREQLQRAKLTAEDANRTKSEFLANMSHEIRTPMNAIIGLSFLLKQSNLNDKQYQQIQKVENSAKHLLSIINDVLDMSKIEAGKMTLEHADFSFDEILDNLSDMFGFKAKDKELEFLYDIDPEMPYRFVGDSLRLVQVLINIISNAIKFTEKGIVILKAKLLDRQDDKVHIRFSVKDSGIGMNEEQIAKIFSTYSQADSSTTRKYGGSGLGLAISQHLVSLMGGVIQVESAPNVGSTFSFDVYLELQPHYQALNIHHLQFMKVLLVDDNDAALEIILKIVKSFGYETHTATRGTEAVEMIKRALEQNAAYDLLILDYRMEGMDGLEMLSALKKVIDREQFPKIIMITSTDLHVLEEKAIDYGIDEFLAKPFSQSHLYNSIMKLFYAHEQVPDATTLSKHAATYKSYIPQIQGSHLLLVEDNVLNQEIAQEYLEKAHITVDIANNGQEALDQIQLGHYDAVLMDCQMPVMDGYDATHNIRMLDDETLRHIPIIAMTANAMQGDREKCIVSGMDDYISKPIDINRMFKTLSKWLTPKKDDTVFIEDKETMADYALYEHLGLDARNALARMADDETLYRKQLRKFATSQKTFSRELETHYANDDTEALIRAAHTLKGLSGNIGATALQEKSKALEACFKKEGITQESQTLSEAVLADLEALIATLEPFAVPEPEEASGELLDDAAYESRLQKLSQALTDFDANAIEIFRSLKVTLEHRGFTTEARDLEMHIDSLDFDEALEYLNRIPRM